MRFTALLHHIYDLHTLRTTYLALKREAAAGVEWTARRGGTTASNNSALKLGWRALT
jgi:hypothetical protein